MGSAVHIIRDTVAEQDDMLPRFLELTKPSGERHARRAELLALRQATQKHLRRSRVFQHSSDPELQAELDALTAELEQVLMRLDLELAEPVRLH